MKQMHKISETRTMALVFATVLIGWIGFSLPYPVFAHLFLDQDGPLLPPGSPEQTRTLLLGAAIAIYPLGQIIGAPLFGRWSDRYGRKPVLQLALLTAVIGALVLAFGVTLGSLSLLFLGRFIAGLGEGNIAIVQSLASDVSSPATKARNFAAIGIAMDLGFVIGPVLGGLLADPAVSPAFGLTFPFWVAAGLFAFNAIIIPVFLEGESSRMRQSAPAKLHARPRGPINPTIASLLLLTFLTYWSIMIFFDFFPVFFVQLYDTAPRQLGINAALLSIPLIVSGLFVGRIVIRWGALATAATAFVLLFAGILLFIHMTTEFGHILPAILVAIGINFGQTATSVLTSDAAPENQQGEVMGHYRAVTVAAGGLAAIVGGYFASVSPRAPFITALLAAALGLGLLVVIIKQLQRRRVRA